MRLREAKTDIVVALGYLGLACAVTAGLLQPEGSHDGEAIPACEALEKHKRFNVLFQHVEIEKLIQTVADATCRTFIVPDTVKGKISVIGPDEGRGEIDAEQFYAAFLAALDVNGLTILRSGNFYRIIDKARANKSAIETFADSNEPHPTDDEMVTRLFRVRNVDLEAVRVVLAQLISPGAEMVPFPPDTLILTEVGANLERIGKLLAQLDVAPSDQLRVIQVRFASVQDVADKIQRILDKSAAGAGRPPLAGGGCQLGVAAERTNKVV